MTIVNPAIALDAYHCPHCRVYAKQDWYSVEINQRPCEDLNFASCFHCKQYTLWHFQKMIYPELSGVQPPHTDLPDEIQQDYLEAAGIVNRSPRGAAALLRLCVEKLCKHLGEDGKDLNVGIKSLVSKGLPVEIQQALDVVRVIGNEAVHPGELDIRDDQATALRLFGLVNYVAEERIARPAALKALYQSLPASKRDAIEKRDK